MQAERSQCRCGDLESDQREREMNSFPGYENSKVWRRMEERGNKVMRMRCKVEQKEKERASVFSLFLPHFFFVVIVMVPLLSYKDKTRQHK